MQDSKRKIRQEKLARLFYEMGMDIEVASKISGVSVEKIIKSDYKKTFKENK